MSEVPFAAFRAGMDEKQCSVDMTKVVGNCDILSVWIPYGMMQLLRRSRAAARLS